MTDSTLMQIMCNPKAMKLFELARLAASDHKHDNFAFQDKFAKFMEIELTYDDHRRIWNKGVVHLTIDKNEGRRGEFQFVDCFSNDILIEVNGSRIEAGASKTFKDLDIRIASPTEGTIPDPPEGHPEVDYFGEGKASGMED